MKRILTALVMFAVFIPVLIFSETAVFPLFLALVGMLCAWEICRCKGIHKKLYILVPAMVYVAVSAFAPRIPRISLGFFVASTLVFLVYYLFSGVFYYGKTDISELSFAAFYGLYLGAGVFSVVAVRDMAPVLYLAVFIGPWVSDAAAMYTGKLFGKKKLCPNISPKKTVAGAIGSMVGTLLVFTVFALIINLGYGKDYSYLAFILLSVPFGIVIQLGDLSASVVKRFFGVKDYGSLLPGHGGAMDRCDSVLPTAICAYAVCFVAQTLGLLG